MWNRLTSVSLLFLVLLPELGVVQAQEAVLGTDHLQLIELRGEKRLDRMGPPAPLPRPARLDSLPPPNMTQPTPPTVAPDALTTSGEAIEFMDRYELQQIINASIQAAKTPNSDVNWRSVENKLDSNLDNIRQLSRQIETASLSRNPSSTSDETSLERPSFTSNIESFYRPAPPERASSSFLESTTTPWLTLILGTFIVSLFALTLSAYRIGLSRREVSMPYQGIDLPTRGDSQATPPSSEESINTGILPYRVSADETKLSEAESVEDVAPNVDLGDDASDVILSFETFSDQRNKEEEQRAEMDHALLTQILNDNLNLPQKAG